jgi:hypothetical protein
MILRWTRGITFMSTKLEVPFGKLKVREDPELDVQAVKDGLPAVLQEAGTHLEIRIRPAISGMDSVLSAAMSGKSVQPRKEQVQLLVWEDRDASQPVIENATSEQDAKLRAEQVVAELAQRLMQRQGRGGYRGEAARAARRRTYGPRPGQTTVGDLQVGDRFKIGPENFQSVYTVEWLGEPRVAIGSQHRRGTGYTPVVKGFRRKVRVRSVGRRAPWGELLTGEMELIQPVWIVREE